MNKCLIAERIPALPSLVERLVALVDRIEVHPAYIDVLRVRVDQLSGYIHIDWPIVQDDFEEIRCVLSHIWQLLHKMRLVDMDADVRAAHKAAIEDVWRAELAAMGPADAAVTA